MPYFIKDNQKIIDKILSKEKSIIELAKERHAKRTPKQIADIQARWNAKQWRNAKTQRDAKRVLSVAKNWNEVDYSILENLISQNNLTAMPDATKDLLKALKDIRAKEKALSDIIPDVHQWHKQFTIKELQEVYNAVKSKLQQLEAKRMSLTTNSKLSGLKKKLDFEIEYLNNQSKYKIGAKNIRLGRLHKMPIRNSVLL